MDEYGIYEDGMLEGYEFDPDSADPIPDEHLQYEHIQMTQFYQDLKCLIHENPTNVNAPICTVTKMDFKEDPKGCIDQNLMSFVQYADDEQKKDKELVTLVLKTLIRDFSQFVRVYDVILDTLMMGFCDYDGDRCNDVDIMGLVQFIDFEVFERFRGIYILSMTMCYRRWAVIHARQVYTLTDYEYNIIIPKEYREDVEFRILTFPCKCVRLFLRHFFHKDRCLDTLCKVAVPKEISDRILHTVLMK